MYELLRLFGRSYAHNTSYGVTTSRPCTPMTEHVDIASGEKNFYEHRLRVLNFLKDNRDLYMIRPDGIRVKIPNTGDCTNRIASVGQYAMYRKMVSDAVAIGAVIFEVAASTYHKILSTDGSGMFSPVKIDDRTFETLPLGSHRNTFYVMTTEEEINKHRYGQYIPWLACTISSSDRLINKNMCLNGYNRESGHDGIVGITYRIRSELGEDLSLYVELNGMVGEVMATKQGCDGETEVDVIVTEAGKERRIGTVSMTEALEGVYVQDEMYERQHFIKMFRTKFEIDLYHQETKFREQKMRDEIALKENQLKKQKQQHDESMKQLKESYEAKLRASDSSDKKNKSAAAQGWAGFLDKMISIVLNLGGLIFGIFSSKLTA